MSEETPPLDRPIRVIMFGGGPTLEFGVQQFICRLEAHPDIAFLAAICQSQGQTVAAVAKDLWQRRRFLAGPLLLAHFGNEAGRLLAHPREQLALNRRLASLGERILFVPDIHAPDVLERVKALNPDLGLIYGSPILKPELFEIPALGTFGIHHGKVPEYRGKKTTFWAMYNGEEYAGVTIQKVNAGLDTGQIVNSGEVAIGARYRRVVWNELEELGLDLYIQSILEMKQGTASFRPQLGSKGKLYRDPKLSQVVELWWRQSKKRLDLTL